MNKDIKNKIPKRRSGYYYLENLEPMVSVTTILKVIAKDALIYWAAQSMFRLLVEDPRKLSDEKNAIYDAIYKPKTDAGEKGSKAHEIIDNEEKGFKYERSTLDPEVVKYLEARDKFLADHPQLEVILSEATGYNKTLGYAGQIDRIVKDKNTGEVWLIDWKTSNGIYPEIGLQLRGYASFDKVENRTTGQYIDMPKVDKLIVVHLKKDGSYDLRDFTEEKIENFLAVKKVYEWAKGINDK